MSTFEIKYNTANNVIKNAVNNAKLRYEGYKKLSKM